MTIENIQLKINSIIIDVLKLNKKPEELAPETPFFSTSPTNPGIVEDSLAILEISSRIAEEFDLIPGEIDEKDFQNIGTLSSAIATLKAA
jgi:acyl carrier protein